MVPFGKTDFGFDFLLNILDDTFQVSACHIGGNHDFTLYVLPADGVRTCQRQNLGYIMKRDFPVVGVDNQLADSLHVLSFLVVGFDCEVEHFSSFIDLRNDFSRQSHIDKFGKFGQRDSVFGKHVPFGFDLQLGAFNLLFHIQVGNAFNLSDSGFDLCPELEQFIEVIAKQLDGDVGFRAR